MDIRDELHDIGEVLLKPGGGPSEDGACQGQLSEGVLVQDEVGWKLSLGVLEDDAGQVEEVDIRDRGLVPQSLYELGNNCPDDARTVSVSQEGLVAVVANVNKILISKCIKVWILDSPEPVKLEWLNSYWLRKCFL